MKLPKTYDTSINSLLELANNDTLFISTWDKATDILNFPDEIIEPVLGKFTELKNNYFFSDEMIDLKKTLINSRCFPSSVKSIDKIGVFSNGTTAAMLAINYINKLLSQIRALLIAPTYFAYIKVLQDLNAEIYYLPTDLTDKAILPIAEISEEVISNKINMVILTIPLFGTGLSPNKEDLLELYNICKSNVCYLLIDYIYGGMNWHNPLPLATRWLWDFCQYNHNIILIESLCKRVFLNGIKSALVLSDSEIIQGMERDSVHLVGSMSFVQIAMLQQLYAENLQPQIISLINANINYVFSNYEILKSICLNTPIELLMCNEGYFCIATMPLPHNKTMMQFARDILDRTNILTIPHERYLLNNKTQYLFRINLGLKKDILLKAMRKLLNMYL